jgi:hypothetical protein
MNMKLHSQPLVDFNKKMNEICEKKKYIAQRRLFKLMALGEPTLTLVPW